MAQGRKVRGHSYSIEWIVLVGDRGILTAVQICSALEPAGPDWISDDFDVCIAHLRMSIHHCRAIRTTNLLKYLFSGAGAGPNPRLVASRNTPLELGPEASSGTSATRFRMRWARQRCRPEREKHVLIALTIPSAPSETTSRGSPRPQ